MKKLSKEDIESFDFKCIYEDDYEQTFEIDSYNESKIILSYFQWKTGDAEGNDITEHEKIKIYRVGGIPIKHTTKNGKVKYEGLDSVYFNGCVNDKKEFEILLRQLDLD
jgi:hypothetical protein